MGPYPEHQTCLVLVRDTLAPTNGSINFRQSLGLLGSRAVRRRDSRLERLLVDLGL